jgi:GNAT superfamily N-acetyltransferase
MLRSATLLDMPRLLELARAMHAESRFSRLALNEEKTESLLAYLVQDSSGFVMVGEVDGLVVGAFAGSCQPHFFSDELVACDLALFVEPGRRGGVLAARLVQAFVGWAKFKGAVLIQAGISTGVNVEASTRLFHACGFRDIGPILEYGAPAHV